MYPSQTLELIRVNELSCGKLLKRAIELPRYYRNIDSEIIRRSQSAYLPAVNARARINWTNTWVWEFYRYFGIDTHDHGPDFPVFLVTIADKAHLTDAETQNVDFESIRRKLRGALKGLDYVGMIEPGFYNAIYDEDGRVSRDVISWHGHFLVWGTTIKELERWRRNVELRLERVVPRRPTIHIKAVPANRFGYYLWYVNKSPCKEYSIGERSKLGPEGLPRYKQNSRSLRPGHRVILFKTFGDLTLPELAMAGGDGREIMRRVKYIALKPGRQKSGQRW